ncbi:NAD-dependent epimerase/dehydratase family protein [Streptomyces sp. NPDC005876]|jgi:nucleoside-diphosphate-sugar epimerase|uniref:NAD-dependent epimerase/dehydratase family protein n=1 Tax=Streptomyces sp. NPDC005876 TaxID=3157076 RepID=UPI0033DE5D02
MDDNVLVTGAAGFIGSHLVTELRSSGRNVVALDRKPFPDDLERQSPGLSGTLRTIRGDLNSLPLGDCLENTSTVFHLAALPGVRPSWTQFPEYLQCNVLATQRLLDACVQAGVARVVVASSSSVYGGADGSMSEDDLPRPLSPYGVTKLAAEKLALAFAARGDADLSVCALRFFTVYGPGQRPDMFISRLIRSTLRDEPVEVYGDGTQLRDFTHVSDVVRALVLAAAVRDRGSTVLNIGTGSAVSVNEVVSMTAELSGSRPRISYGAPRIGDVRSTTADVRRADRVLGFTARTGLREGLATQIEATRRALAREGQDAVTVGGSTASAPHL